MSVTGRIIAALPDEDVRGESLVVNAWSDQTVSVTCIETLTQDTGQAEIILNRESVERLRDALTKWLDEN